MQKVTQYDCELGGLGAWLKEKVKLAISRDEFDCSIDIRNIRIKTHLKLKGLDMENLKRILPEWEIWSDEATFGFSNDLRILRCFGTLETKWK